MSEYSPEPRKPGRPTNAEREARAVQPARAQEVQQRRRRRETLGEERNLKLHVPEQYKDKDFTYRWVNARDGRVRQMTEMDDWDVVSSEELNKDAPAEGTVVKRVGDKFTGENMVLLRKRKEFHDEDQKKKQDALKEMDGALRKGLPPSNEGLGGDANHAYIPGGRNIVNGQ